MNDGNIFGEIFDSKISKTIILSRFLSCIKKADVTPPHKK